MTRYNVTYTIEFKDIEAETEEEAKQKAIDRIMVKDGDWKCELEVIEEVG